MKRGWLVVVGIGLQVAALQLLLRIMESAAPSPADASADGVPTDADAPTPSATPRVAPADDEPHRLRRGSTPEAAWDTDRGSARPADVRIVEPPAAVPTYVAQHADVRTQVFRGYSAPGWVTFGVYGDGTLRMVDVDGGRFEGTLVGSSATMRAARATSSFDVDFTSTEGGRRRVHFRGGRHDARSLDLDSIGARIAR